MRLEELHFKNYRLFQELNITGLKRVNLIAGKNNTGKTALLEGIRILAARGDSTVVNHILDSRGEFTPAWDSSYTSLFFKSQSHTSKELKINELVIENPSNDRLWISWKKNKENFLDSKIPTAYPKDDQAVFIPYVNFDKQLKELWENIQLDPKEEDVLNILRETVLPNLKRIAYSKNKFMLLLENNAEPLPIGRFGDGVIRILGIALALANAQDKILLIDEFESGLHHSIQETLWKLVFKYTKEWNTQAFLTTHSEDTLKNFFYIGNKENNRDNAFFIRLQYSRRGVLELIPYDMDRLGQALELHLEIR